MEAKDQNQRREPRVIRSQREQQEKQKQAQLKKRKTGIIATAVASLTLFGASAGLIHSRAGEGSELAPVVPQATTSVPELVSNLPEITNKDVVSKALPSAADYTRVVGVPIAGPRLEASVSLAPSLARMTSAEKQKYCAPGLESKCREAAAITQGPDAIYFYTDAINKLFPSGTKNTEETRNSRNELISWALLHEISHWKGEQSAYEPSDELFNLVIKYAGEKQPVLKDPKYVKDVVKGTLIRGKDSTGAGAFEAFKGLEEAEAENISRYILQNRGGKVYANLDNPNDTYFIEQRRMLDDLLRKLNPDYGESVKWLAQMREKKGGREEIMKTVGKKFDASDETALENGFKIMFAIDAGDTNTYKTLVAGK